MGRQCESGFTLIEVMIVVVIVAILAAVAVPSYQNQIQKTRRADAKEALTRAAAAQERWFFSNNQYTDNPANLGFVDIGNKKFNSIDGHYTLEIELSDDTMRYTITANATSPSQQNDAACQAFVINQAGLKTATKAGDADNTAECWR